LHNRTGAALFANQVGSSSFSVEKEPKRLLLIGASALKTPGILGPKARRNGAGS
jgi:hypothetical protein